jgi:hypothetical protein
MPFVTSADVATLHGQLDSDSTALDEAVSTAITSGKLSGDSLTARAWHRFTGRIAGYLADEPSSLRAAAQMDTGQQLQRDLVPWYARLAAAGVSVPPAPAPPPPAQDLFGNVKDIVFLAFLFLLLREVK